MKRTASEIELIFKKILKSVEDGTPLRQVLANTSGLGSSTFYKWLDESPQRQERYARAKEIAAEVLFDQIIDIAKTPLLEVIEEVGTNGDKTITKDNVQRSRLLVDAIKWRLAKERPEKYGDKLDITSKGEALAVPAIIGMTIKNEITPEANEPIEDDDLN